jgi:hypothetical protein
MIMGLNMYAVVCDLRPTQVKLVMAENPARAVEVVASVAEKCKVN